MSESGSELGSETGSERTAKAVAGPTITLRALAASDLDSVLVLARETAEAPQWSIQNYEQILLSDPSAAFSRLGFVAHYECALAGFAVAGFSRPEQIAEIETIVVHPRLRRRRIGTQLLIAVKAFARGAGATRLRLEVRESNPAAIALYFAHGFQLAGRRSSYYSGPVEDALLLELCLASPAEESRPG